MYNMAWIGLILFHHVIPPPSEAFCLLLNMNKYNIDIPIIIYNTARILINKVLGNLYAKYAAMDLSGIQTVKNNTMRTVDDIIYK